MASFYNDKDDEEQQQGVDTSGGSGGGAFAGGDSGGAPTPQGSGGEKQWMNIQEYLGANPNQSGGASVLDKNVGSQFGKEEGDLSSAQESYKSSVGKPLSDYKDSLEFNPRSLYSSYLDSKPWLDREAGKQTNYDPNKYDWSSFVPYAGDDKKNQYQNIYNSLSTKISSQAPQVGDFGYSLGSETKSYGDALSGGDQPFNNLLGSLYQKEYPGFSEGQRNLQNQIDSQNSLTGDKRSELSSRYQKLSDSASDQGLNNWKNDLVSQAGRQRAADQDYLTVFNRDRTGFENDLKNTHLPGGALAMNEFNGNGMTPKDDTLYSALNNAAFYENPSVISSGPGGDQYYSNEKWQQDIAPYQNIFNQIKSKYHF